jgi:hypothetical protein
MPFALEEPFIRKVSGWVADYISTNQQLYAAAGNPLNQGLKEKLAPFFSQELLESVVWSKEDPAIKDPAWFRELLKAGLKNIPSFAAMAAVTFADVVVHREKITPDLAFHEMVHAEQYRQLGIAGFAERYVRGFLSGGSYMEIPLEKQAYDLEARFSRNPKQVFSVEEMVANAIRRCAL